MPIYQHMGRTCVLALNAPEIKCWPPTAIMSASQGLSRFYSQRHISYIHRRQRDLWRKLKRPSAETPGYLKMIIDKTAVYGHINSKNYDVLDQIKKNVGGNCGETPPPDEDDYISSSYSDYPVNQDMMNELVLLTDVLLGPAGENQGDFLDLFPSVCEGIIILVSPFENPNIYLRHIVKECSKRCSASFLRVNNRNLFSRVSASTLLRHTLSEPNIANMRPLQKNAGSDFGSSNSPYNNDSLFPNILGLNVDLSSMVKRQLATNRLNLGSNRDAVPFTAPYPWFDEYSRTEGGNPPLITRDRSLVENVTEYEKIIFCAMKDFFSKISASATEGQRIVVFYEDLLHLSTLGKARLMNLLSAISLELTEIRKRGVHIILKTFTSPSMLNLATNGRSDSESPDDMIFCIIKNNLSGKQHGKKDYTSDDTGNSASRPFPDNSILDGERGSGKLSQHFDPLPIDYLGVTLVNVLPPLNSPKCLEGLKNQLCKDFYIINLEKNLNEILFLACSTSLRIEIDKRYFHKRISEANKVYPPVDPLEAFGSRKLMPPEIERIILCCMGLMKQSQSTGGSSHNPPIESSTSKDSLKIESVVSNEMLVKACEIVMGSLNPVDATRNPVKNGPALGNLKHPLPPLTKLENDIYTRCIISSGKTDTKFSSIGGLKRCKQLIKEVIQLPLTMPELFSKGILKNNTTGLLIFGPPGTGKTLVCRAVSEEAGVNFLNVQPSTINSMWLGESEKNICAVFSLARKLSPCIIFVDEVDSILSTRSTSNPRYINSTVNQFMQEWDGIMTENKGVIVIGTTNRPFDMDEASLRRFPRRIMIDVPDVEERKDIISVLLKEEKISSSIGFDELVTKVSELTHMFTGSDLKNLCISAALNSARDCRDPQNICGDVDYKLLESRELDLSHFTQAIDMKQITPSLEKEAELMSHIRAWNKIYGMDSNLQGGDPHSKWGFT